MSDERACDHPSSTGVDQTHPNDPNKVWLCHQCGSEWTHADTTTEATS